MRSLLAFLGGTIAASLAVGQDVTVTNGGKAASQVVVTASVKDSGKPGTPVLKDDDDPGFQIPAQFDSTKSKLTFVVPSLGAKSKRNLTVYRSIPAKGKTEPAFSFAESPKQHVDVLYDNRKVLRFMNMPRDGSSKDNHELTFKPFHHVYDPVKGETLLTNGAGLAANKDLLFPHHRGLFFAFNKVSYGAGMKETCDVWHGRNNEYVEFDKMLATEAGPAYARHRAALSWHGKDGKVFASEERELTVYRSPGGTLLDFDSTVTTTLEKVRLDGDPQHAGFHFRAAMEVAKNGKTNTYYLRPDGKDKIGATRNWEPKNKEPKTINLPWDACSFVIEGKRYTVLRMVHPKNPKETRGSERDYGRFGDYFEWDLTPKTPLHVNYRVWIQAGEMSVEQCQAMYEGYTNPPMVKVG